MSASLGGGQPSLVDALGALPCLEDATAVGAALRSLVSAGADALPLPGGGRTRDRWRALARVAAHDLALVKLYEGHTDALAIMAELGAGPVPPGSTWATWAAEPPDARVELDGTTGRVGMTGRKAWCSGAGSVTHGLLTAWRGEAGPYLVAVDMASAGVHVASGGWQAVGMDRTASVEVRFDGATGEVIGGVGDYLARPGFWQGGIGVAACWYGGALALAEALKARVRQRPSPHAAAHLGAVDAALTAAGAVLGEAADLIDARPEADAQCLALRARAVVEDTCERVVRHVGRALGAGPYCLDRRFARMAADLPVFVRQSHAERDLEALGEAVARQEQSWTL